MRAYVVRVVRPDAAIGGGLLTTQYVVLTSGPEIAAAIVRHVVGQEAEVEPTGDTLSTELTRILELVPDEARLV